MKKILGIFLATTLLLTGCSSNSQDNTPEELETQISNESTIEYRDVQAYLEKSGKNLINYLKSLNIEYKSSSQNTVIVSKSNSYEKYDTEYTQSFRYNSTVDYQEDEVITEFNIDRQTHIDDELDFNNSYMKLIYKVIQSQDKSFTENKFKSLLNDYINNEGNSCIFENEAMSVIAGTPGGGAITISLSYLNKLDIENNLDLTNEYKTVKEFKNKVNELNLNDYNATETRYLDNKETSISQGSSVSALYEQVVDGNLKEFYSFTLLINRDERDSINIKMKLEPSDKELLSSYILYMTEITGIDISQYITADQLYEKIEDLTTNPWYDGSSSPDSSLAIGRLMLTTYPEMDEIRIDIPVSVIAEGKTRL